MHPCFPHPSCLPGHGSPCSRADRPHGVSRACVSWAVVGKTGIYKCSLHLSSSLWLGSKPLSTCSWRGESGVPTDLLLLHIALQPYKGVSLPCVRPQDLCVQYMARTTHTQGISPTVSSPLYSESSPMGTRQDLNHPFPFIHFSLCIFL